MATTNDKASFSTPFGDVSIVDLIKKEADELANSKEVSIPVKGYEQAGLQVKYHLPETGGRELDEIARRVTREISDVYARNLLIAIDTMIWLCVGLYVQPEGVDEPVMLDPQESGMPVQFDARLAEIIGLDGDAQPNARNVVKKLFGGNDLAIINHAEKLNRWLQDTKANISLELWQISAAGEA